VSTSYLDALRLFSTRNNCGRWRARPAHKEMVQDARNDDIAFVQQFNPASTIITCRYLFTKLNSKVNQIFIK